MIKHLSVLILLSLLIPAMANAQHEPLHKSPIKFDTPSEFNKPTHRSPAGYSVTAANFIEIDTMSNTFGPASPTLNPVAFDPVSGVAAVVHRGDANTYAQGSGELWWNYSSDMGMTWTRSTTSVQDVFTSQLQARYPSMTIFNPSGGSNIGDALGAFSWPELNPANPNGFEWLGYGVTDPGMETSAYAEIDQTPPAYATNSPTFTDNQYVYWTTDFYSVNDIRLFRTTDYVNIEQINPPQWAASNFVNGNIQMGGVCYNGEVYVGVMGGFFAASDTSNGWFPGYSVSDDNGSTWSDFNIADWRTIPTLADYGYMWDWKKGDSFVSYSGDINVDKNGMVHFVVGLTHYIDSTEYGDNAIVELYETAKNPSTWAANIIADNLHDSSLYVGPAITIGTDTYNFDPCVAQSGESPFLATNLDRDFFVSQWTYKSPDDSTCEIYMRYRYLDSSWSAPINITQTPQMNEDGEHLAPYIAVTDSGTTRTYTAFSMYWYESGYTGRWPNPVNETSVFMAAVPVHTEQLVGVANNPINNFTYKLQQNYPNPFNPTTIVKYSVAERTNVTLKVYDMLGREVATLVNTTKDAGSYEVNFDASRFASGVYIYKIQAGNFIQSRKMMLLK